jgi:hypothetical protein
MKWQNVKIHGLIITLGKILDKHRGLKLGCCDLTYKPITEVLKYFFILSNDDLRIWGTWII